MVDRKILHIDMDAFFASVEQLDNPDLRGLPVIVGGDPAGRGVVAACSYEARRFGIHSAMSCARAGRLCPQARFVRPRKERYREISGRIMEIFRQYSDKIEPLSIDEAFLDVTANRKKIPSATWTAHAIRRDIFTNIGLTASAGVSCNKFLAKIASDMNKPDGLTVITPEQALPFIHSLPIRKFYGVGRVTEQRMLAMGIKTGADLLQYPRQELINRFGKSGNFFYDVVRGKDNRPVCPRQGRKSIGSEVTLKEDVANKEQMLAILTRIATQVAGALAKKDLSAGTLILKIRYSDFVTVTRSRTLPTMFTTDRDMMAMIPGLLARTEAGEKKVRLLGITTTNLRKRNRHTPRQLKLPFSDHLQAWISRERSSFSQQSTLNHV
ncbi:MAG TPA: DNA polymerase IV [Desulfobulbaceae bacterium]|nr:DNA polymerase IV [Desulfobulbaceae bacterium]